MTAHESGESSTGKGPNSDEQSPSPWTGPNPGGNAEPLVIGLIGGVASGKSTIARVFRDLGCLVADADRYSHQALEEPAIKQEVTRRFGRGILDASGKIDRKRLVGAFARPADLRFLESILHPRVVERVQNCIQEARRSGRRGVVVDAPLLLEAGLDRVCDVVVMVEASDTVRRARAIERGLAPEDWARREANQKSIGEKRTRADHTVVNEGPIQEVRRAVESLWQLFLARPGSNDCIPHQDG
jgi:dephospho-CoA kinase